MDRHGEEEGRLARRRYQQEAFDARCIGGDAPPRWQA
jgi:hypothetical protein